MSPGIMSELDTKVLGIISIIGMAISLLCTLATIVCFFLLWRHIKSDKNCILLHLCIALTISYVIFLIGIDQTQNKIACISVAVMLHYFFLVVFFLMLSEAVSLLISIVYVFATSSKLKYLLPLGWGLPLVIVSVSGGVTKLHGYGTKNHCWLSTEDGLLYAFVGPAMGVIIANYVVVVLALKALFSTHAVMSKSRREKLRSGVRSISTLAPILGLTWVFGVFSVNQDLVVFQYLFAIFNSLQGFFIFLFHCLLNKSVTHGFRHKWRGYKAQTVSTTGGSRKPGKSVTDTAEYTRKGSNATVLTGYSGADPAEVQVELCPESDVNIRL
ncbi:adhesion G-protein coupled receptor D1-like isoform X2 [Gigantopelta aegis]|nr:adhesion G-protein coupled receptor D1-like isoform X2 [Gigantopelta aegis]